MRSVMSPFVRATVGPVSELWLARPDKANALLPEMGQAIAAAVRRINAAPEARVVLLRAEGQAFCAGGDLSVIEAARRRTATENVPVMQEFYRSFLSLLDLRVPAVALVQGAAFGAGLCLALACDLRIVADEAKLCANFVRIGLHPGMAATLLLPNAVGEARARELLLTGRVVTGAQAASLGLSHVSAPRAQLGPQVDAAVAGLLDAAPLAVARTKATLMAPIRARLPAVLRREAEAQALDFASDDAREALEAFEARRAPRFRGQ